MAVRKFSIITETDALSIERGSTVSGADGTKNFSFNIRSECM